MEGLRCAARNRRAEAMGGSASGCVTGGVELVGGSAGRYATAQGETSRPEMRGSAVGPVACRRSDAECSWHQERVAAWLGR